MRSRCGTSRHGGRSMEVDGPKLKEEPQLSGAYIRNLVKQLSSSMPKGATNPRSQDGASGDGEPPNNLFRLGEGFSNIEAQKEQHHQEKATLPRKQTRRRVCTSKPYQERLINMAEARREIVTALKFHRAAMKRASEQQQQQQRKQQKRLFQENSLQVPPPPPPSQDLQKETITGRENPRVYPSNNNLNMLFSYFHNPPLPSDSYPPNSWPYSAIAPLPIPGSPNLTYPSRPLGLNLNLQDFNSIDINLYSSSSNPPMLSSTSSISSPPYSHSFVSPTTGMPAMSVPSASDVPLQASTEAMSKPADGTLHPTMGDEEMAEIRSIGEQHDMEWNDKLNVVTSAWWGKLLETMEASPPAQLEAGNGGEGMAGNIGLGSFDEVMNMPSWLSTQQEVADDYYCSEYLQDSSLPCLDIGEIEGTDCEWL